MTISRRARPLRAGRGPALLITGLLLCAWMPRAGSAQAGGPVAIEGRVVNADGAGVGRIPVTVHVIHSGEGPLVETTTAGPDGAFRFRVTWPGAAEDAQVFASASYLGVRYATERLPGRSDSVPDLRITVYDTTVHSRRPPDFRVAMRRLFVQPAGSVRAEVLDAVEIVNATESTWVATPEGALWRLPLPKLAEAAHVAESDLGDGVRLEDDALAVRGPVVPGHAQVLVRYFLPIETHELPVPIAAPTDGMEVLLAESLSRGRVDGLEDAGTMRVGVDAFRRFTATRLGADHPVRLSLRRSRASYPLHVALVTLVFLVVVVGAGAWHLRREARLAAASPDR